MAFGLGRAGGATVRLAVDDAAFNRDLNRAEAHYKTTVHSMVDSSGALTRGIASSTGAMSKFGGVLALTSGSFFAGAGLGAAFSSIIGIAGNFEKSLNVLQAVLGATAGQMKLMRAEAIKLGNDAKLPGMSAKDAAEAMTLLAKAGLNATDAMTAARGTLQLATVAETDVGTAATIAASALNAFHLSGSQASMVTDVLSASANASQASIEDMGLSLQQAGSIAYANGLSFADAATAITEMSKAGIAASDAGTSLRVMLSRLTPTTKKAKDLIAELGVSAYNSKGQFLPFRDIIQKYHDVLVKLTPQARQQALITIFGQDAQRAANIVLREGVDAYDKLHVAISKQGVAAQQSAAQNKGFTGALDAFKSSVETLEINIGTKMLPKLTEWVRSMTAWLSEARNQKKIMDDLNTIYGIVAGVIKTLVDAVKAVDKVTGSFKRTLELLLALKVAFVIKGWTTALQIFAAEGLIPARVQVVKLRDALATLTAAGTLKGFSVLVAGFASITAAAVAAYLASQKVGNWLNNLLGITGGGLTPSELWDKITGGGKPKGPTMATDNIGKGYTTIFNGRTYKWDGNKWVDITPKGAVNLPAELAKGAKIVPPTEAAALSKGGLLQGAHHTEGFPGSEKNAVDIALKPGAKVLAPEDGWITRAQGSKPGTGDPNLNGYGLYFRAVDGSLYYIKHLATVGKRGFYKKGAVIATVAAGTQGGSHIHVDYDPPIKFVTGKDTATPPSGGISPGGAPSTDSGTDTLKGNDKGKPKKVDFNLQVPAGLTPEQERVANLIYDTAIKLGATPQVALAMVVGAWFESKLSPNALGGGLFQIQKNNGAYKRYMALIHSGVDPATAAVQAMLGQYMKSGREHPGASPDVIAGGAERPAYGQTHPGDPYGNQSAATKKTAGQFKLTGGTPTSASDFPDPISVKLQNQLLQAQIGGNLEKQLPILDKIIEILNKAIAKTKDAAKRNKLLNELQGYLGQRKDVRAQIAEGFKSSLSTAVTNIGKDIAAAEKGIGQVEDIVDKATGKVIGKQFAEQTTVRWDPKTHTWITVKIRPTVDAAKKELDYIMKVVVPGIQKRIDSLNVSLRKYAKHPKANAALINSAKKKRAALIAERDEIIAMAQDLAQWIADMETALAVPPDAEGSGGGGSGGGDAGASATPFDYTSIPTAMRLAGALAGETPGFADDISYLRSVDDLYTQRLAIGGLGDEDRIAVLQARQGIREQLASADTSVDLNLQLAGAQARRTVGTADDRAVTQQIYDIALARLAEAKTIQEQIALTNQLADLEEQLKNTRAEENQELIQYLTSRRELVRQYAGTLYSPSGMAGGGGITLNNYFGASPTDPHLFSSQVAFDLGALVS